MSHMKPPLNICSECEMVLQRTWKSHKQWHLREPPVLGTALEGIIFQLHPTSQESCVDMSCWQVAPKDINAVLAFLFLPTPAHSGQLRRSCAGGQGSVWLCCDRGGVEIFMYSWQAVLRSQQENMELSFVFYLVIRVPP